MRQNQHEDGNTAFIGLFSFFFTHSLTRLHRILTVMGKTNVTIM